MTSVNYYVTKQIDNSYGITWTDTHGGLEFANTSVVAQIAEQLLKDETQPMWLSNQRGRVALCNYKDEQTYAEVKVVKSDSCDLTEEDLDGLDYPTLKVAMPKGRFRMYYPLSMKENMPWEGRPWLEGFSDCYRLAVDYYRKELDIPVRSIVTPDNYTSQSFAFARTNLFLENFKSCGFEQVLFPAAGDALLLQTMDGHPDDPDHLGVYLGDGKMLHHNRNLLSAIVAYTPRWKKRTAMILRHQNKF